MALTPLMEQYLAVKRQYSDAVVLFRLGDFYEVFFDDAPAVATLLDLTLTARDGGNGKVPMCGVPYHAVQGYIARLVKAGKKVAICEQVEDPKVAKGLVKREVVRVVTPSTFIENDADPQSPLLLGVAQNAGQWGLALLELTTGVVQFWEEGDETLLDTLACLNPIELVTTQSLATSSLVTQYRDTHPDVVPSQVAEWESDYQGSVTYIKAFFRLDSLRALELTSVTTCAVALVLRFLQRHLQTALPHITLPKRRQPGTAMLLGPVVERSLELFRPANPEGQGKTLFNVLDTTQTPMGRRLLHHWLSQPLVSISAIVERHDAVAELVNQTESRDAVRAALAPVRDLERLAARFSCRVATPKDAAALRDSLAKVPTVVAALESVSSPLLLAQRRQLSADLSLLRATLDQALVDVPPLHLRDGGIFSSGYDAELDRLRSLTVDAKQWLAALQAREIACTGISSLKVGYTRVFGYYLEVSNTHKAKVPPTYIRKQTLANAERYITPELQNYEEQILHAEERAVALEQELFVRLCAVVLEHVAVIQAVASALAQVDVLVGFAWLALCQNYVRPEMTEEPSLDIVGGRHPVVEAMLGRGKFIENDTQLNRDHRQLLLLTAPNMSGKSVYLRQTALIVLLAHIGSFVPAQRARIGIVDRIFTRIGAADNLALGESTFAVEMIETAHILNYATPRSLLLLDEIGRGTSTADGLSIARAIVEFLVDPSGPRPRTLFATHFYELTELQKLLPGVENYTFAVREWHGEVIFLYKVVPGAADQSYGVHVATLAGLPRSVTERAQEILRDLEARGSEVVRPPRRARPSGVRTALSENPAQLGLFRDVRDS